MRKGDVCCEASLFYVIRWCDTVARRVPFWIIPSLISCSLSSLIKWSTTYIYIILTIPHFLTKFHEVILAEQARAFNMKTHNPHTWAHTHTQSGL